MPVSRDQAAQQDVTCDGNVVTANSLVYQVGMVELR